VTIGRKGCRSGRCPAATVCTAGPCASRSRPRCRNRASKTTGGTTVATSFDAANRPTSDSGGGSYGHDAEGRMTARPGQTLEWDSLGRLTKVRDSSTNAVISSYTYDALDRLREETRGGTTQRFRYVGTTTRVAQIWNVTTSASVLYYGIGWDGDILAGWLNPSGGRRYFGTNAHGDITWTTDGPGAVNRTLRYDPWGETIATSGTGLPPFRFQGSWRDGTANLYWVVARWYAPTLGTFVSEDELLGEPDNPRSRHLYAYGWGEPLAYADWDGRQPSSTMLRFRSSRGDRMWHLFVGVVHVAAKWTAAFRRPYTTISNLEMTIFAPTGKLCKFCADWLPSAHADFFDSRLQLIQRIRPQKGMGCANSRFTVTPDTKWFAFCETSFRMDRRPMYVRFYWRLAGRTDNGSYWGRGLYDFQWAYVF
jgi:RHS repeat-associated protein